MTAMEKTKDVIRGMLVENTGRAMMDSGDYYGRHWQRNQGQDFEAMDGTSVSFSTWGKDEARQLEVNVTHNVYQWLLTKVERSGNAEKLQAIFDAMVEDEVDDRPWLQMMEIFANQHLPDQLQLEVTGIYGEGRPMTINTYNNEDLLSQTIQYVYFEIKEGDFEGTYALLQIHGGCDARGGYTRPKMFELTEELGLLDNARASILCENGDHRWYSDDGCNFYPEHEKLTSDRCKLTERGVVAIVVEPGNKVVVDEKGRVPIDPETKTGYCPLCASKLSGYFY